MQGEHASGCLTQADREHINPAGLQTAALQIGCAVTSAEVHASSSSLDEHKAIQQQLKALLSLLLHLFMSLFIIQ